MNRTRLALQVAVAVCLSSCRDDISVTPLSGADSAAIKATQAAYVAAWLRDDTTAVLATLDSNAVLMPPQQLPIQGHAAIRQYWWPRDGSRTKVTSFDLTSDELTGAGPIAYSRGISRVSWTYDKDTVHQVSASRSSTLTLLRRGSDRRWLITHQMWSPSIP